MPSAAPPKQSSPAPAPFAAICAAAAVVCLPLTQGSEGFIRKAEPDPVGILTGCYGERVDQSNLDPSRVYSKDECAVRLRQRLATEYAPKIAACLPEVATERRVKVFGALLDAGYNAGSVAVCNSRMARSIRAGDWVGACNGLYGWYTSARDRRTGKRIIYRGLVTRRTKEAALCREGL